MIPKKDWGKYEQDNKRTKNQEQIDRSDQGTARAQGFLAVSAV